MAYIKEYTNLQPKELRQLTYKRRYKKDHPEWDDSMIVLRDQVAKYANDGGRVLDVGCGHGNFVIDELRDTFTWAEGIDVSREVMSKNICLDHCTVGDVYALPFANESFDTVLSLWMLEHIEHPETCFKEIYRVLKPGGIFAFVTPNKFSALITFRRLLTDHTAEKIVEKLYDRAEADTFPVRYEANNIQKLSSIASAVGFLRTFLKENPDPSYTSFGTVSYHLSAMFSSIPLTISRPHIIGIFTK